MSSEGDERCPLSDNGPRTFVSEGLFGGAGAPSPKYQFVRCILLICVLCIV